MIFILDGNSETDAHPWSNLDYLICMHMKIEGSHKSEFCSEKTCFFMIGSYVDKSAPLFRLVFDIHTVSYLDVMNALLRRFLSRMELRRQQLQLLGVTCLLVAWKVTSIMSQNLVLRGKHERNSGKRGKIFKRKLFHYGGGGGKNIYSIESYPFQHYHIRFMTAHDLIKHFNRSNNRGCSLGAYLLLIYHLI